MARKTTQPQLDSLFGSVEPAATPAAPAPKRKRAAAPIKVAVQDEAPSAAPDTETATTEAPAVPVQAAADPVDDTAAAAIETTAITTAASLPALDAPSVNTNEPAISYKIDFSDKLHWHASTDGGKTKASTNTNAVGGCAIDLALQINKASWGDGFDQRLRLAFMQSDGQMAELNVNAINTTQAGELYVTSPARSLVGGLLAISESDEDITAFCEGARFRLRAGRGRGMFIEVDLACNGQWIGMTSPAATNQVAKDPAGLHTQLTLIKQRFRAAGFLLTAAAVIGEIADYDSFLRHLEDAGSDD